LIEWVLFDLSRWTEMSWELIVEIHLTLYENIIHVAAASSALRHRELTRNGVITRP